MRRYWGRTIDSAAFLWTLTAAASAAAVIAGLADHRRSRRRDLDRVGWAPWPTVLVVALFAAATCAALAIRIGGD